MKKKLVIGGICFLIAAGLAFFGVQFYLKTGIFKVYGTLKFGEEMPETEVEKYTAVVGEMKLEKDVTISEYYEDSYTNGMLLDVFVPVADFYEPKEGISAAEFAERWEKKEGVVSVLKLDESQKLLKVGEDYYLDSLARGAKFKLLKVEGEDEEDVARVTEAVAATLPNLPKKETVLTFAQTGVTAMSRGMNAKMAQVGDGKFFSANIAEFLRQFDLTHTSNESSFSNWASAANICSDPRFIDTLVDIGLDVVELTGNHNVDCGYEDAIATFEKYQELGIKTVGGGRSATEAEVPLTISRKGTGITMLAYNQSTGGATWGETPGANQYYPENAQTRIAEAKARGDFVIVDVQFNECNAYASVAEDPTCDRADSAPGDQVGMFRSLIDMGADVVVGTSAHQTQTFERYNNGEIYYGLGNLFFDQIWWPGTTRSLGLTHYFWNGKLLQIRRFGTVYDANYQTRLMNTEEIEWFINRLNQAR
ncbi:CapA family protein [Candidatus Saccharibacteria bacterium]|nr:CapA family protein [Candidatus Saccharibacteria bacterium]